MTIKNKKLELIKVASRLFASNGYHETSMEDIAFALGMSKSGLYYHIGSKQDLLAETFGNLMDNFSVELTEIKESNFSSAEKIRRAFNAHIQLLCDNLYPAKVFFNEKFALLPQDKRDVQIKLRDRYQDIWQSIVSEGMRRGEFRPDLDPEIVTLGHLGMCNWVTRWYKKDGRCSPSEIAQVFARSTLYGIQKVEHIVDSDLISPGRIKLIRQVQATDREREIIEVASRLFASNGYHETSMEDIASALGGFKSSLYYHIGSKQDLLADVIGNLTHNFSVELTEIKESNFSSAEKIRRAFNAHIQLLCDNLYPAKVFLNESFALLPQDKRDVQIKLRDRYQDIWQSIVSEGMRRGEFRPDLDPEIVTLGHLGMCNWVTRWYKKDGRCSPSEIAQVFARSTLYGIQKVEHIVDSDLISPGRM